MKTKGEISGLILLLVLIGGMNFIAGCYLGAGEIRAEAIRAGAAVYSLPDRTSPKVEFLWVVTTAPEDGRPPKVAAR
jgi:hypothetical protein